MRETGLDSRLRARSFAALTVHWTVIHYRSYFKSRESLRNAKKEAVIVTASLFLVRETGLDSRLQARSFAALTVHWTVIHYRSYFKSRESLRNAKKEAVIVTASLFLVRETGLEPVRVAPHAPQTCASADSATLAFPIRLYLFLSSALRRSRRAYAVPLAVPKIFCGLEHRKILTATPFRTRFIRHRRRFVRNAADSATLA